MTAPTEREALEAQIAAGKAAEAKLAAMDGEQDYEAWREALAAFYKGCGWHGAPSEPLDGADKEHIDGLVAAFAHTPLAPMTDAPDLALLREAEAVMSEYLPILSALQESGLWDDFAKGTGIATGNRYVATLTNLRAAIAQQEPPRGHTGE